MQLRNDYRTNAHFRGPSGAKPGHDRRTGLRRNATQTFVSSR